VLLSNTNEWHLEEIERKYPEVLQLFDGRVVLSFKEHRAKPSAEVFLKATSLAGAGIAPSDCIYLDDRTDFVETARGLGMHGIVYRSHARFVQELRRHGIYVP
jgi:HAD superfamily hydrolase (TIGR01509 family)